MMETEQTIFWEGTFGVEYTERNNFTVAELDEMYLKKYGITRTAMNKDFLEDISTKKVLEVGCDVANQLRCLQSMGYNSLYGIELQNYAVEKAKELTKGINIIQGSGFEIPFKDNYFDLVFTSGVLIHISPKDIHHILDEIYRVSKRYIWGFEYFTEVHEEIPYRGNNDKLWKANFMRLFIGRFPDLRVVKEQKYKYVSNDNVNQNQMYLLEKVTNTI